MDAIERQTLLTLMILISIHFFPTFFLLQLNLTYLKRILHVIPVKIIILKSSYNWLKLTTTRIFSHIHGHLNY